MRKIRASVGIVCVTAAAVIAMTGANPGEKAARVQVVQVIRGDVEQSVTLGGQLRYETEYAALSPSAGVVAQVYVKPGDAVTAGQALFRLDDRAEVAALSAALGAAESLPEKALSAFSDTAVQAGARLEMLTVRARTDGLVQEVAVSEHGGIAAGAPGVVLTGTDQQIICQAVTRDAAEIRRGMGARIISGDVVQCLAVVTEVGAAQTDGLTGQVMCAVTLHPEGHIDLPLGAPVEAEIVLASAAEVPVIPVTAFDEDGSLWWIGDGRVWQMGAEIILQDEVNCWVQLPPGTALVDQPDGLIHGQPVEEVGS